MDYTVGRSEFEVRSADRDYSGLDLTSRYLAHADIERSFFNGSNLSDCVFDTVRLSNTEFSEANITVCTFLDSTLSGSDFVSSLFSRTRFERCDFTKGEWRDSTFRHCVFVECNFDHTTLALCMFRDCTFDAPSLTSAEHRAIYFNIMSRCDFGRPFMDAHFLSRNFGVPAAGDQSAIVPAGSAITIEQMCLLNNTGHLRTIDVAGVAESICNALTNGGQRRPSTLTFYSKILRVLTEEDRISATSLIYIEQLITEFATRIVDQDLFTVVMSTVVEIRSALFSLAGRARTEEAATEAAVEHISIRFNENYTRRQADALRETLAHVAAGSADAFVTESVRSGSTIIEIVTTGVVALGALMVSVNFVLHQAKVTVRRWGELKRATASSPKAQKASPRRKRRSSPNKVPAVLKPGAVLPELIPVREAVARHGRTLVEMDEKAEIMIGVRMSFEQIERR